jgi:hypothetical protein
MKNIEIERLVNLNEDRGRVYLKQIVKDIIPECVELYFSPHQYSEWDALIRTPDNKYIIEIKCRDMVSTKYYGYIIEERKLQYLLKKSTEGYIPIYINFFKDGKCLLWDLRFEDFTDKQDMYCNKVTVNPNAGKKLKTQTLLNKRNATEYNYVV